MQCLIQMNKCRVKEKVGLRADTAVVRNVFGARRMPSLFLKRHEFKN